MINFHFTNLLHSWLIVLRYILFGGSFWQLRLRWYSARAAYLNVLATRDLMNLWPEHASLNAIASLWGIPQSDMSENEYRTAILERLTATRPHPFGKELAGYLRSVVDTFDVREEHVQLLWMRYHLTTNRELTNIEQFAVHKLAGDLIPVGILVDFSFNGGDPVRRLDASVLYPEYYA